MVFKIESTNEWHGSSTFKRYPILKDYNPSFDLDNDTLSIEINTLEELWDLILKLDEDLIIGIGNYKNSIEPSIEIYNTYRE